MNNETKHVHSLGHYEALRESGVTPERVREEIKKRAAR
jgi:hypothetical protein